MGGLRPLLPPAQHGNIFANFDKVIDTTRKFLEALEARKVGGDG